MAQLEEYLQDKYVENYAIARNYPNKQELLNDVIPNLLLKDGNRNYIIKDGKVYYLINKTSLPQDIQDVLTGGNTTEYAKYIRLQDVYGITDDLTVYYCDEEGNNTYGDMTLANVDPNLPVGKINNDAGLKEAITDALSSVGVTVDSELGVTLGNLESIGNKLELDGSKYTLTNLDGLSELRGLVYLTLSNLGSSATSFSNLNGLESLTNLKYIYFKNCYITDYSRLSTCWDLQYLYMYLPPAMPETNANDQVTNLGTGLSTATQLEKLNYFGISGVTGWIEKTTTAAEDTEHISVGTKSLLNNVQGLTNFAKNIKNSIQYLIFTNTSITSFSFLNDWTGLMKANLTANASVSTLSNFGTHSLLERINFSGCEFSNLTRSRKLFSINIFRYPIKFINNCINWD